MTDPAQHRRRPYTTGDPSLDAKVQALVDEAGSIDPDLTFEMIVTALRLSRDEGSRLDRKIANSALKEMRYAFRVFAPYRSVHKVSVFGSARTRVGDREYVTTRDFSREIASRGWMVVTGAGPGIMQAGNEGAGALKSFGVNIRLPFESKPNEFIAADPKLVNFKYFFTRKLIFMKESDAFALLPGGWGTFDETFELLALVQTGKSDPHPIVLLDVPGGHFWARLDSFMREELVPRGLISPDDLNLYVRTDDVARAVDEITGFYRNYHSIRYHGRTLIIRLQRLPGSRALGELEREFADILEDGRLEPMDPTPDEVRDSDALEQARLGLRFGRVNQGRLRLLIDRLNES